ncbi:GH25 family lysozyme [Lactobacillus jensenii]|uniref:GH25 family lysozyme n=1 Tax=Lactobacillus jensenii TaxID=109790 RepID=UPI0028701908|nr:GH25 family lysozyme [Lactobacillus jensenii]
MVLNAIDIASPYQNDINIAATGADIVIIKVTEGTSVVNPYWKTWADQTLAQGKCLGLYHWATEADTTAQVNAFFNAIGSYKDKAMLFVDYEDYTSESGPKPIKHSGTRIAREILEKGSAKAGKPLGLYIALSTENSQDWSFAAKKYPLWVAQYNVTAPTYGFQNPVMIGSPKYWDTITLHQWTGNGHISGHSGKIDISVFYGDKATWNKLIATTNNSSLTEVDEEMAWHPEVKWNQLGMFRINREGGINLYTSSELAFVTKENGADAVRKYGDFIIWQAKGGAVKLGTNTQWASQADGLTKINPLAVNDNAHAKCKIVADDAYTQDEPKAGAAGIKHLPKGSTWTVFGRQDKYLIVGGGSDGKYVDGDKAVIVL